MTTELNKNQIEMCKKLAKGWKDKCSYEMGKEDKEKEIVQLIDEWAIENKVCWEEIGELKAKIQEEKKK